MGNVPWNSHHFRKGNHDNILELLSWQNKRVKSGGMTAVALQMCGFTSHVDLEPGALWPEVGMRCELPGTVCTQVLERIIDAKLAAIDRQCEDSGLAILEARHVIDSWPTLAIALDLGRVTNHLDTFANVDGAVKAKDPAKRRALLHKDEARLAARSGWIHGDHFR